MTDCGLKNTLPALRSNELLGVNKTIVLAGNRIISQSSFISALKKLFKKGHLFASADADFFEERIQYDVLRGSLDLELGMGQAFQRSYFPASQAAAIKHTVIMVEKTMGVVKAYLQLKAVTAAKQMASAHAVRRMRAKVSAGRPPSCHANTAANKRNTEKKNPNALKKSQ